MENDSSDLSAACFLSTSTAIPLGEQPEHATSGPIKEEGHARDLLSELPADACCEPADEDPERTATKYAKAKAKAELVEKAERKEQERLARWQARASNGGMSNRQRKAQRKRGAKAAEDEEVSRRLEQLRALPEGAKMDYSAEMLKHYHPKIVEFGTYAWWEQNHWI